MAELQGIPLVSAVAKIEVSDDGRKVTVQRKLERADREVVEVELPALLTIELGYKSRYPTVPSRLAANEKSIDYYDAAALSLLPGEVGLAGAKTMVLGISPPRPRAKKLFAPDSNLPPEERMRLIMTGGIQEKKGDTLEGNPRDIASKLVGFLRSERLLPEEDSTQ